MNPLEILKTLQTPKDWATFALGACVGITLTTTVLLGLKNVLNLDLVTKGSYYSSEQIAASFVPSQTVNQLYTKKEDVAARYVSKAELERNYYSMAYVAQNYVLKADVNPHAADAVPVKIDLNKYMPRSDLSNFISKADVQRMYYSRATCEQEVLRRRRIREDQTLNPGDQLSLPAAGIVMRSHNSRSGYVGTLEVWRTGTAKSDVLTGTHFEKYDYNGRRITFRVLSATNGSFRVSLTEDQ